MSHKRDVYEKDSDLGTFQNITWNMPAASHSDSEEFHRNDMVWVLNKQAHSREIGKIIYTFPEDQTARISFGPHVDKNGHVVYRSADVPYSDLIMYTKYYSDPNPSIVGML